MNSSIFADLKKFAGKIESKKISPIEDVKSNNELVGKALSRVDKNKSHPPQQSNVHEQSDITIDTIVANIKLPMIPIKDDKGAIIHDSSTIAIKCGSGHIHKYFIKDILSPHLASGLKCKTCTSGNKFSTLVRTEAEKLLSGPFSLNGKNLSSEPAIEYFNPLLKIAVACARMPGENSATRVGEYTLVIIRPTQSQKKIRSVLSEQLMKFSEFISAELREKLKPTPKVKNVFQREPLPYTYETAALNISHSRANPIIAQMQMNIVSNDTAKLCLENC
jgi:hypothetical protein